MSRWKMLAAILMLSLTLASGDSGADFLQSVIRRMQDDRFIKPGEDYLPTPLPDHQYFADVQSEGGSQSPMPPLSKGELLALYQAAVSKGAGLNLSALTTLPLTGEHHDEMVLPSDQGTLPGYYYYFYPINSFLADNSSDNGSHHDTMMTMMDDNMAGNMAGDMKETRLDPLFLAMAGFVSMATIVSFSILFLPKFGDSRSRDKASLKEVPEDDDEMFSLTRVVGQAIQGKDCGDRLACELGRAIRSMKLGQKPIRVLEAMLPPHLAKQLSQVRQHMVNKDKCHLITCKRPPPKKPNKNTNITTKKPHKI